MANVNNTNGGVTYGSPSVAGPNHLETNGHLYIANDNLKRIADALETIIKMVKQDMEKYEKKKN